MWISIYVTLIIVVLYFCIFQDSNSDFVIENIKNLFTVIILYDLTLF